jgi:DNA-directed RNA polymerase beta subunit
MQMKDDEAESPAGVTLYDWDDFDTQRQNIFDKAKTALESQFPQAHGSVRLELHDTHYVDPESYTTAEQKSALMGNRFLHRRLRGTFKLFDTNTGVQIDEKPNTTLARIPYLTERGTFIVNGNEMTHISQSRLKPGVYIRRKESGTVESHFNVRRGTGRSFRIHMEPDTGLMKMEVGQSSLRLYSLLKDLGVSDERLEKSWGPELLAKNRDKYDARVFEKAYQRLAKRPDSNKSREEKAKEIMSALSASKLDREVMERTLPNLFAKTAAAQPLQGGQVLQPGQAQEQQGPEQFGKSDYQMLAAFLNKQFRMGIPLDVPVSVLVQTLIEDLRKLMPGVTAEGLAFAMKQYKNNSSDYTEEANNL